MQLRKRIIRSILMEGSSVDLLVIAMWLLRGQRDREQYVFVPVERETLHTGGFGCLVAIGVVFAALIISMLIGIAPR